MWDMNRGSEDENRKAGNVPISSDTAEAENLKHHHHHSGEQQVKFVNKTEIENQSSGIDSGFMSGPQLSAYDSSDESDHKEEKISTTERSSSKKVTLQYSDSGCAEENITTDSGLSLEGTHSRHMILDSGVDTGVGLSEWFCNLSLKDNNNTPLNNLSSTKKSLSVGKETSGGESAENKQQQQQQKKQPWQIYYQQNSDGDTQLHIACITGYTDVISALIQLAPHPCLLDIQNDEALTALHIAVLTGQTNLVRMLLLSGASPFVRDRNGNTPLHLACSFGDLECIKALTTPITLSEVQQTKWCSIYCISSKLPQGLELRNYDGERCVHLAAQSNHINVLRHLMSIGADINAREGKSGRTPLHIAIEMCNEELANFLLEECKQKLNLETATYAGLTAYQLAVMVRFSQIQHNLEKHGAEPLTPPDSDQDSDSETELSDSQLQYNNHFGEHFFGSPHNGGNAINVS